MGFSSRDRFRRLVVECPFIKKCFASLNIAQSTLDINSISKQRNVNYLRENVRDF